MKAQGVLWGVAFFVMFAIIFALHSYLYVQSQVVQKKTISFDKVFIITLKRTQERTIPLQEDLKSAGMEYELFFGVDGKELNDAKKAELARTFKGPLVGEIGCWLSHLHLWHYIARQPDLTKVLILEDDTRLSGPFHAPDEAYDIVYHGHLGSWRHTPWLGFRDFLLKSFGIQMYRSYGHLGAHAYHITPLGARKVLAELKKRPDYYFSLPVDSALLELLKLRDVRAFTQHPVAGYQSGVESEIDKISRRPNY